MALGQLDALRSEANAARSALSALASEQQSKRDELSLLSSRIESLKAKNSKKRLLRGSELELALKESQKLADVLTGLAQQRTARQSEFEKSTNALIDVLSSELVLLRQSFDATGDREKRKSLIQRMKQLRAERDAARAMLPSSFVMRTDPLEETDDPEYLLEQADLLRDREEKVRRQLDTLKTRIAERREETEMNRRVERFLGEESMFDDQDRRIRLQKPLAAERASVAPQTPGPVGFATPATSEAGPSADPTIASTPKEGVSDVRSPIVFGSDARPQVGEQRDLSHSMQSLSQLETDRLELEAMAAELKKKATDLESRAATLDN